MGAGGAPLHSVHYIVCIAWLFVRSACGFYNVAQLILVTDEKQTQSA